MQVKTDTLDFDVTNLTHNGQPIGAGGTSYPWRGAWVTATAYVINDCVEHDGSGYVCIVDHTSDVFATDLANGYWELLVSKGVQGAQGIQGIQGLQGDQGPQGTAGTNGLDGTQYPWQEAWLTGTAYVLNDCVEHDGSGYVCITAHTSGDFATDLAANKWSLLVRGIATPFTITNKTLTANAATRVAEFPVASGDYVALELRWVMRLTDGTDQEISNGVSVLQLVDKAGSMFTDYQVVSNEAITTGGFKNSCTVYLEKDEANDKAYIVMENSDNSMTTTSAVGSLEILKNWQNVVLTAL